MFDEIQNQYNTTQIITVTSIDTLSSSASLTLYEKKQNNWIKALKPTKVKIGRYGMTNNKIEKDGKTPMGLFHIGPAFGSVPSISNKKITYRKTTSSDYWIDDPLSSDYNQWVNCTGDPYKIWSSFERLDIPSYKYALVIQYNSDPIVPGKGSAVFIHIRKNRMTPTSGCVALSEGKMIRLLNALDEKKNPMIWIRDSFCL